MIHTQRLKNFFDKIWLFASEVQKGCKKSKVPHNTFGTFGDMGRLFFSRNLFLVSFASKLTKITIARISKQ